jgi:hypothetical protein
MHLRYATDDAEQATTSALVRRRELRAREAPGGFTATAEDTLELARFFPFYSQQGRKQRRKVLGARCKPGIGEPGGELGRKNACRRHES